MNRTSVDSYPRNNDCSTLRSYCLQCAFFYIKQRCQHKSTDGARLGEDFLFLLLYSYLNSRIPIEFVRTVPSIVKPKRCLCKTKALPMQNQSIANVVTRKAHFGLTLIQDAHPYISNINIQSRFALYTSLEVSLSTFQLYQVTQKWYVSTIP